MTRLWKSHEPKERTPHERIRYSQRWAFWLALTNLLLIAFQLPAFISGEATWVNWLSVGMIFASFCWNTLDFFRLRRRERELIMQTLRGADHWDNFYEP